MTTKERPILMSAPMVRAILDGRKTQTRRVVKLPKALAALGGDLSASTTFRDTGFGDGEYLHVALDDTSVERVRCPYGQPGDRLWVRETWGVIGHAWDESGNITPWTPDRPAKAVREMPCGNGYYSGHVIYAADGPNDWAGDDDGGGEPRSAWRPSIHMPRLASRITLEITGVGVERLQDISEGDARSEGCQPTLPQAIEHAGRLTNNGRSAQEAYRDLWESINGHGSWAENPWVWVVEFTRVEAQQAAA